MEIDYGVQSRGLLHRARPFRDRSGEVGIWARPSADRSWELDYTTRLFGHQPMVLGHLEIGEFSVLITELGLLEISLGRSTIEFDLLRISLGSSVIHLESSTKGRWLWSLAIWRSHWRNSFFIW